MIFVDQELWIFTVDEALEQAPVETMPENEHLRSTAKNTESLHRRLLGMSWVEHHRNRWCNGAELSISTLVVSD